MSELRPIKRALISVSDRTHLADLARFLVAEGIEIVSTGNTARFLADHKIAVKDISWLTQFPEILDGRVKTLSARVFAGILFDRCKEHHRHTIDEHAIAAIDLVVVNLYPFATVAREPNVHNARLIEHIDVGGPAMMRAAAKNCASVTVLSEPSQYEEFMTHYRRELGTRYTFRKGCAIRAFSLTADYDQCIARTLGQEAQDDAGPMTFALCHQKTLRYGENPHQKARVYSRDDGSTINLAKTESDTGKELSFNNLLDANAAIWSLRCLCDHRVVTESAAVVVKHGIPCGAALAEHAHKALALAIASDPTSAFGGIIAQNYPFDLECAKALGDGFLEVLIAPQFSLDAVAVLSSRKNLRLLSLPQIMTGTLPSQSIRTIFGGALVQDFDTTHTNEINWTIPTKCKPSSDDKAALDFAFRIVKTAPSNAISLASKHQLLGLGSGQPNRIQSVELAIAGAQARGFDIRKAALASDAFFPFDDALVVANHHSIRLIIQPGGSIRDREIIARADELGMCMVFTHQRHFRH